MAARPLNEAVQQAEEAISGGNYQLAVETCRRVLGQFPEFATAHRLLAEAHLEAGDVDAAEQAFHEVLQRDPQSSAAYAGLATIAERKGDIENALAYAQVAWEIMPQRTDLRDRVVSLSERQYGKGGRLHLTRPALTSLHFRAGRWSRAASEAASVLVEHPGRVDVHLRMAEALWRRGSLTAAANACRGLLESAPSTVMALLMLADIERRDGNQEAAEQLLERARAIDPDGVRAADLVTIGSTDLAEFMLPAHIPEFDDSAEIVAEVERPRIAPAPDFSWPQPAAQEETAEVSNVAEADSLVAETAASAEAPAAVDESDFDVSLPDDAEIEAARPPARAQRGYTSMLESLEGEGLMPFHLEGEETPEDLEPAAEHETEDDMFGLVSDEEIEAARPPTERPHGYTTLLNSLDETGVAPFEIEGAPGYPTEQSESTEVEVEAETPMPTGSTDAVDYGTDLTAGWDDIDAEIQRATPSGDSAMAGYTSQLRDLDEIGIQPFSVEGVGEDESPTDQLQDDLELDDSFATDFSFLDAAPEVEAPSVSADAFSLDADLTDGWATIDEEIQNAIPSETPRGYTDELNELNRSGVEPFLVEADEAEYEAEPEPEPEVEEPASASEEDVVSDELAAGIDLWSVDGEPVENIVDEVVAPVDSESVSDVDLFDFADTEMAEEEPTPWEPVTSTEELVAMAAEESENPVGEDLVESVDDETMSPEGQGDDAVRSAIAHLGVNAALFERARQSKAQLVESQQIEGDHLLPGVEPPGPSLESLEQMVQENPEDLDVRRQLVGAMLDAEQFERAFGEFQWMFRNRLPFEEQDLSNLTQVAERSSAQQVKSHRLLGAVYRRSGNLVMSARYYQLALVGSRGSAEKEA